MTVPASVPSLFHSWRPIARKKSVSPTRVRLSGVDEPAPGLMSLTSLAPEFGFAGWAGATDTVARRKQIGATRSACSLTNALIIALLSVRDEPDVKDEPHQSTATHGTRRVVGLAFTCGLASSVAGSETRPRKRACDGRDRLSGEYLNRPRGKNLKS